MSKKYRPSPFGVAKFPWLTKPDTGFGKNEFKVDLEVAGVAAAKFRDQIDTAVDLAFEEVASELPAAERKKWEKHYPYEAEEDESGNPTGTVKFKFRQNATIKLTDGGEKAIKIGIYDAKDQPMTDTAVWAGSVLRTMFAPRTVKVASAKKAGVRLDFSMVQVKTLVSSGSQGFGESVEEDEGDSNPPSDY